MKFQMEKIATKYRPAPFWSLNSRLQVPETDRQVRVMFQAGLGGFFMHARGGLQTPYMGEEWFDNIEAAIRAAEECGTEPWAYDENGWPSGFGNGAVNGLGEEYQQKYLRIQEGERTTARTVANVGGYHLYYDVNPYYVDLLDKKVTEEFIRAVYEPYYRRFGNRICGFFTDEPQLSRDGIPWSLTLPDAYRREYGDDLLPLLPALFYPVDNYRQVRFRFWRLVTKQFSENFVHTLYRWCDERGLMLTGHMLLEESLSSQLTCNGAVMPHYEYFHIPGMDWLGRYPHPTLTALQVSSVAQQLGREQVLSESFAGCGHHAGFDDFKRLIDWQMVRGITRLCPHLEGYSLRGIRKRDYPPAMYYQQPWWEDYPELVDTLSRTGQLLSQGRVCYDTLLLHPQSSAWVCFDAGENAGLSELEQQFQDVVNRLERKHIRFHLGDETIMERHARVEDGALVIGTQRYTRVIIPPHDVWFDSTERLLEEFRQAGGMIVTEEEVPADDIVDNPAITCTERIYDDARLFFFVNTTGEEQTAVIRQGGYTIAAATGEKTPFCGQYRFRPAESLLVLDDGTKQIPAPADKTYPALPLDGDWQVVSCAENALVLDQCDYYFDDELIEKNGYVLDIQQRACARKRPVKIKTVYTVTVETVPEQIDLVCETPEKCRIYVNGQELGKDTGWYIDKAFRRIPVNGTLHTGVNCIEVLVDFTQSEEIYRTLEAALCFEGEKNKLTFDTEVEPIYLVGNFGVRVPALRQELSPTSVRYTGEYVITDRPHTVSLSHLQERGFPFFAGSVTLQKTFPASPMPELRFTKRNISVVKAQVNGGETVKCMWEPLEAVLSDWHPDADNTVLLTLTTNLRNLLGPHHIASGAGAWASPDCFYREPSVFGNRPFESGYELEDTGLESRP